MKWVLRAGSQVAIRANQWAESWVSRAPLEGMPYWGLSVSEVGQVRLLIFACGRMVLRMSKPRIIGHHSQRINDGFVKGCDINDKMNIGRRIKTYIVQNNIVCRDAIARNKKQCLVVDLEDLADLARSDFLDVVLAEVNRGDGGGR